MTPPSLFEVDVNDLSANMAILRGIIVEAVTVTTVDDGQEDDRLEFLADAAKLADDLQDVANG